MPRPRRSIAKPCGSPHRWGRSSRRGAGFRRVAVRLAPDPAMSHAASFLYLLTGERPNSTAIRALDVALILHADHELNASTFAGRVAAATLTDIYSAIVAAIGTLKGPLARRSECRSHEVAARARADGHRRTCGRSHSRQACSQGEDSRASAIASTRPKILGRRICAECPRISASGPATPPGSTCRSESRRWSRARRS